MDTVVIIGGGPAGLFCGLQAAGAGRRVIVLEKKSACGRKLLITGTGQCNLTHGGAVTEFLSHYGDHGTFLRPAPDELQQPRPDPVLRRPWGPDDHRTAGEGLSGVEEGDRGAGRPAGLLQGPGGGGPVQRTGAGRSFGSRTDSWSGRRPAPTMRTRWSSPPGGRPTRPPAPPGTATGSPKASVTRSLRSPRPWRRCWSTDYPFADLSGISFAGVTISLFGIQNDSGSIPATCC